MKQSQYRQFNNIRLFFIPRRHIILLCWTSGVYLFTQIHDTFYMHLISFRENYVWQAENSMNTLKGEAVCKKISPTTVHRE